MANERRGYTKLVFTPAGGTAITLQARKCKPNPQEGQETVNRTIINTVNFQIVDDGTEIIKAGMTYTLSEIFDLPKAALEVFAQLSATGVPGTTIVEGTGVLTMHDRLDATGKVLYLHTGFKCQITGEWELMISDLAQATVTVKVMGSQLGTVTFDADAPT
jgi:hypothetical protein